MFNVTKAKSMRISHNIVEQIRGAILAGELKPGDRLPAEKALADCEPELCRGLESAGLKAERRALRVMPRDLDWTLSGDGLRLRFSLPSGSYATSVLREVVTVRDAS